MNDIEEQRRKASNEFAWQREYLLNIVPAEDQVVDRAWIQYYDVIPPPTLLFDGQYFSHIETNIGIDLAISKRDTADYTAMVPGRIYETGIGWRIYILPYILNRRLSFPETVDMCKMYYNNFKEEDGYPATLIIEDVAYQKALPQQLESEGIYDVKTTRPGNMDKRSRLMLASNLIKNGTVLFPREGAEELIQQIVHFGVEKHDDLMDAFCNLVLGVIEDPPCIPRVFFL